MKLLQSTPSASTASLGASKERLKALVEALSFPRPWKSLENERAAKIIIEEAQKSYTKDNIGNIVFGDPLKSKILVGAHYDSCSETPGADDNASAVAVMLEVLKHNTNPDVCFVAFNAEENNILGSGVFAEQLKNHKLEQVHIFEMVGYTAEKQENPVPALNCPTVGNFLGLIGDYKSNVEFVIDKAKNIATPVIGVNIDKIPLEQVYAVMPQVFLSDHSSFWQCNIPAIMWTDTSFYRNPNYHQKTDTPDTLNYDFMEEVANLMLHVLQ